MQPNLLTRVPSLFFLIAALPLLSPLLASASGLVWSDRPSGTKAIRACNFDGSNVRNLYSSAGDPRGVIVDAAAERVYFCDRFGGTASSGEINSVPLAGGARQQHLTLLNRPADLRFDSAARTLYWCEENAGLIRAAVAVGRHAHAANFVQRRRQSLLPRLRRGGRKALLGQQRVQPHLRPARGRPT